MKYLSLFSGIGGFELGIQQAYERLRDSSVDTREYKAKRQLSTEGESSQGKDSKVSLNRSESSPVVSPTCIGFSEIDKYATAIYQRHFPDHKNYGDITAINADTLPDFDLLVGGFPCQAFSIAGKRKGFDDTRGTLFFEIARILRAKQPRLFLLENVKGLLSHDNGRTFATIIATLDELGYDLQWQVLNSKNHGVPQNRERIFIAGHLRGTPRPEVFPFDGCNSEATQKYVGSIGTPRIPEQAHLSRAHKQPARVYSPEGISPTLSSGETQGRYNIAVGTLRTHKDGNGFRELKEGISPTIPARAREDGSGQPVIAVDTKQVGKPRFTDNVATLGANDYKEPKGVYDGMAIRRLTPTECERLQGFPDEWTRYGLDGVKALKDGKGYYTKEVIWNYLVLRHIKKKVRHNEPLVLTSDTQRYKTLGNAVTVNVIQDIMSALLAS